MSTRSVIVLGEYFEDKLIRTAGLMDWLHVGLDLLGFIPGIGEVADGANAGVYLGEGDYKSGCLSIISMIPEIGDAIAKSAKAALWWVKESMNASSFVGKYGSKAGGVIKRLIKQGFEFFKANKNRCQEFLKSIGNDARWAAYKQYIPKLLRALEDIYTGFNAANVAMDSMTD